MTVKDLRKALKGVRGDVEVYTADHDHAKWMTNGLASGAYLFNQAKDLDDYEKDRLEKDPQFKIKGNYFVIHV